MLKNKGTLMKAVILAGGLGTRISEESHLKPKPMIEIGGKPILWHIMKQYSAHGIHDFVICLGYKGYAIKDFFANYFLHTSDVTFDMSNNRMDVHQNYSEPWRVTLIDTGEETMTGGRLRRAGRYLQDEEAFCFTYGDGVSDLDISALVNFHRAGGKLATVTAVQPPGRYGALERDGDLVRGRWRLDQRWFLRPVTQGPVADQRRLDHLGSRAADAPGRRGATQCLSA